MENGEVFHVRLTKKDGITPKNGKLYKDKFLVYLGSDTSGSALCGVVINSHINQKISAAAQFSYPIKKETYRWLSYDSFVNCATLFTLHVERLRNARRVGKIEEEDYRLIVNTTADSPFLAKMVRKRFPCFDGVERTKNSDSNIE